MISRYMLAIALIVLSSCAKRADYALVGSAEVPGTHGDIKVERIDRGQLLVTLVLDNLAPPEQLEGSLTSYALWFQEDGQAPVLKGVLDYDSEERVGRGMATTSLRVFRLIVTGEPTEEPEVPSDFVVAAQRIDED